MAYNPSYNRFMLLLAAVVLLIMILEMEGSEGTLPSPYSASAVEYWEKILPNVPLPSQLLKKASPLASSTELIAHYKDMISSGRVVEPAGMCNAARLYCSAQKFAEFRQIIPSCGLQIGFRGAVYETDAQGQQTVLMQSHGDFFRESALVEGANLVLGDQKETTPPTTFLPRPLAALFQPVSAHLLWAAFSIPSSSLFSKESMHTSQLCKADAEDLLPGEEAFCAYSLEDLADQLKAKLVKGTSSLELLPVSGASANSVSAKLLKVELQGEATQPYLSCHARTFPFAVHFCHHIPNTRIHSATLRSTQGELIHAVALCHLDTSAWSPLHVAFVDLQSTPGQTEACHWTHENGLIFVPTDE